MQQLSSVQQLSEEVRSLNTAIREKENSIDNIKSELYSTKEKLEVMRLENAKLKDTLDETSNELMVVKNKNIKSFSSTIQVDDNTLNFDRTHEPKNLHQLNQS